MSIKMRFTIILQKMESELSIPVNYFLVNEAQKLKMNDFLGKSISIEFTGNIYCIGCGKKINKTFGQGYCYPCFVSLPQTEECVLRPELCLAHEGIARDMEYARINCLQDHYVYLSATPEIKVGVTRKSQIPVRWIDQGADSAMIIARTPNRYTAGLIEVELKKILPDKTNWRKMLSGQVVNNISYNPIIAQVENFLSPELKGYLLPDNERNIISINYPVLKFANKATPIDLDKDIEFTGLLTGIKGQYLIFESGRVINIRKYTGYQVTIKNNTDN